MGALGKISLDMPLKNAELSPRVFAIRFAEGHEPIHGQLTMMAICTCVRWFINEDGRPIKALIMEAMSRDEKQNIGIGISWYREEENMRLIDDELRLATAARKDPGVLEVDSAQHSDSMRFALKAALTLHILADDPSIITPDVLSKDRERYDSETDEAWKQRAVERARRRGIVGWNLGADYEVCPHYRRPHLGLRYTGKGKSVPRIVPIKGSVVHRSRLTEVPTGYLLSDGTEVERGQVV